ncbi:FBD-associated F-box protein At5g22730-like [Euphorbia lathyris]|uniref:FBD-associated F-box protein At5g22730-like n=1 Tax=Euphorbia lathyris TaxID=212925 RepID=UPI0033138C6C
MDSSAGRLSETAGGPPEKKGTSTATGDMDLISRLPDELLCRILYCVSLRDAVRTSALSHRWQYISACEPLLQFNFEELFLTDSNYESFKTCEKPCIIYTEKFVEAVNQYLRYYKSENALSFKLDFCLDGEIEEYIDRWVKFALRKGVENISLSLQCSRHCLKNGKAGEYHSGYVFRTELFDNVEIKLRHLELNFCILGSNFTYQFSLLSSISFSRVHFPVEDMDIMLSFLVNLKRLDITKCILPEKLGLGSVPLLQKFVVYRSYGLEEVQLSNPNLTDLKCFCSNEIKCNLSGAPKLEKLSYAVSMEDFERIFTNLPEQNAQLTTLTVVSLDDWIDWAPPTRLRTLNQVTSLDLHFILPSEFSLVKTMAILQAFPHLSFFCLMMTCPIDLEGETIQLSYVPQYLKQMVIAQFFYTPMQMEFAIHLLKNASALEKMSIAITPESIPIGMTLEEGHRLITQKLQAYDKGDVLEIQMFPEMPQ